MDEDIIQIIEPTQDILDKAGFYISLIKNILPSATVTLIGSLAIPLCVKNEMDILVEIDQTEDILKVQEKIRDESSDIFGVGPIVDDEGFSRSKKKYGIRCELHILHTGNQKAVRYQALVEYFKSNPSLTRKYNEFKRSLHGLTASQYNARKSKFFVEYVPRYLHGYV